jgi:adenine-specific DNA methylase
MVLLAALTGAGFVVESTGAVHAEMSSSIHIRGKQAPQIDMVVCCCSAAARPQEPAQTAGAAAKDRLNRLRQKLVAEQLDQEDARVVLLGEALKLLSARAVHEGLDTREAKKLLTFAAELGCGDSE